MSGQVGNGLLVVTEIFGFVGHGAEVEDDDSSRGRTDENVGHVGHHDVFGMEHVTQFDTLSGFNVVFWLEFGVGVGLLG